MNHFRTRHLLHLLVGEDKFDPNEVKPRLLEFWRRYSKEYPDFTAFTSGKSLSNSIPCMIHGDEGRGFKKLPILLLSWQGVLGRGTRPFQKKNPLKTIQKTKMGVNMLSFTFSLPLRRDSKEILRWQACVSVQF